MKVFRLIAPTLLALAATTAESQTSLSAHNHGDATLQIAIDGSEATLVFTSPAYNLLGFEYAPRSDAEREKATQVSDWFKDTPLLSGAGCQLVSAQVHHDLGEGHESESHHDHESHSDDHSHHDDHDDHESEEHGHHEEDDAQTHSELEVSQSLKCDELLDGSTVATPLMAEFDNLQHLSVEWVSGSQQGATKLSKSDTSLSFRR